MTNARPLCALVVALALVFQTAIAERHFEPLASVGAVKVLASGGPSAPVTGRPDTDCAVCQFLALGVATDVPHDSAGLLRPALDATPRPASESAKPRTSSRVAQARAPPSPRIA